MEFVTSLVSGVVTKIGELSVDKIVQHYQHLVHPNRSINKLRQECEQLSNVKQALQALVDADRNDGRKIAPGVEKWLHNVESIEAELQPLYEDKVHEKNQWRRYSLSRKAAKRGAEVLSLIESRGQLQVVSYPAPPRRAGEIFTANIKNFQSRTKIIMEVTEKLKNDEFKRISICGMGGVGKTTMVKEVIKIVEANKLFDKVAFSAVSQPVDYRRVQGDIAGMLGLKFETETPQQRASEIVGRLKIFNKVLIVLDDVWEELDFESIGLPASIESHQGCKILFTSRDQHVCNKMRSQENFIVPILSPDEAWDLFREMAGSDICDQYDIYPIAKEIADECRGLPIAIVTVGKALVNKRKHTWNDVRHQLKNSPVTSLEMQKYVYLQIQLSYDLLDSEEHRDCLLLCCLFPEDSDIPIEVLMRHGLGMGLFKGVGKLLTARNRVHDLVDNLKSRFLLLDSEEEDCVKMHDVVREAVLWIASRGRCEYIMQVGVHIKRFKGDACDYRAMSLMLDNTKELPVGLECSHYQLLQVASRNKESIPWPEYLLQGMTELKVLSMEELCIPKPVSVFKALHNLWTLRVENCEVGDISIIGKELTKLEILSFSNSNVKQLPSEIGQLGSLRLLDLTRCNDLYKIHSNVLASLSRLEELYIGVRNFPWQQNRAVMAELKLLSHQLKVFEIRVKKFEILPKDLVFENLETFWVYVGKKWTYYDRHGYLYSSILEIRNVNCNFINNNMLMRQLVKNCEILYLESIEHLKNLNSIPEIDENGFSPLKHLMVKTCDDLEFLIIQKSMVIFSNLVKLKLNSLPNLIGFAKAIVLDEPNRSTQAEECRGSEIVEDELHSCGAKLFTGDCLQQFPKLEILSLYRCSSLDMVFDLQESSGLAGQTVALLFPQMKKMEINELSKLKHVWSNVPCNVQGFGNLTLLRIEGCGSLRYVFTPSIVGALKQLEEVEIIHCQSMEEFVSAGIQKDNAEIVVFAKLDSLKLDNLPSLASFCSNSDLELAWPSLRHLGVNGCHQLNHSQIQKVIESAKQDHVRVPSHIGRSTTKKGSTKFLNCCFGYADKSSIKVSSPNVFDVRNCDSMDVNSINEMEICFSSPMPILQHIDISNCDSMDIIISSAKRVSINSFAVVESFELKGVPNLVSFCRHIRDSPSFNNNLEFKGVSNEGGAMIAHVPFIDGFLFPNLSSIRIQGCHKINSLFSPSSSVSLGCLRVLSIGKCDNIEEIVFGGKETQTSEIVFPELRCLELQCLANFKCFCSGSHRLEFPSLEELSIIDCPRMEELSHGSCHRTQDSPSFNNNQEFEGASNDGETTIRHVPFIDGFLFPNLSSLQIRGCHKINSLFSLSFLTSLDRLKVLNIKDCDNIEEIVFGRKETQTSEIVFPELQLLKLECLANLRYFCSGSHHLKFPSLEGLSISDCPKMEELSSRSSNTPKLQDISISGKQYEIKYMHKRDLNAIIRQYKAFNVVPQTSEASGWSKLGQGILSCSIKNHENLLRVVPFDEIGMFQHVNKLTVDYCTSLVEVFESKEVSNLDVKKKNYELKEMKLKNLPKLMHIWKSLISRFVSFTNLRELRILQCHNLTSVLPLSVAQSLVQLQHLRVENCNMIEEIVVPEKEEMEGVDKVETIFPELEQLHLLHLPNLKGFCSAACNIELPSCHEMVIRKCSNMTTFSHGTVSTPKLPQIHLDFNFTRTMGDLNSTIYYIHNARIFEEQMQKSETFGWIEHDEHLLGYISRVRKLNITGYESLLNCVPSSMMHRFQHLIKLRVTECDSVVEIFESEGVDTNNEEHNIILYELKYMILNSLPKLVSIWKSHHASILGFQNLFRIEVKSCHSLKSVFPLSIAKSLPFFQQLRVWDCKMMEEIVALKTEEGDKISQQPNDTKVIIFPWLGELELIDLPSLRRFCAGPCDLELPYCYRMTIKNCRKMESFCDGITFTPDLGYVTVDDEEYDAEEGLDAIIQRHKQSQSEGISLMAQKVCSDDPATQLEATTQFRKLLSIECYPTIDEVIKAGVVPKFVEFLGRHDLPQLQFEAAWALTIVASGTSEHMKMGIGHGIVPLLAQLLSSDGDDIKEEAYVTGDSPSYRDLVLSHSALVPLLSQLNQDSKLFMLRNAVRNLSNFCEGEPPTPFEQVKPTLLVLRQLIHLNDEEVLRDACQALAYLSNGPNETIQVVIDAGVYPRLVELLLHPVATVLLPALQTVGNIVMGADARTQSIIDNQVLQCLYQLLTQNHEKSIKEYACRIVSIITATNRAQIQAVFEANIFLPLLQLLQHTEFDIKMWAAVPIYNAISGGSHEQIRFLVGQGCLQPMCDILTRLDKSIVTTCLKGLENILKVGEADKKMGLNEGINVCAQMIDACEGLDKIKNLQTHDDDYIYEVAMKILEVFS